MKIKNIEDMSKEELKTLASQPSKPTAIIVVVSSCAATAGLYSWLKLSLGQSLPDISQVIWLVFLVTTIYKAKSTSTT